METLPNDIQRSILQKADIPIDSYLHYKKEIGLLPNKLTDLHIPPHLATSLNELCNNRVSGYKQQQYTDLSCNLVWFTKNLNLPTHHSSEIMIAVDKYNNNEVKMAFRILYIDDENEELWTVRKTVVNMHTGELTTDWTCDSDDDAYDDDAY